MIDSDMLPTRDFYFICSPQDSVGSNLFQRYKLTGSFIIAPAIGGHIAIIILAVLFCYRRGRNRHQGQRLTQLSSVTLPQSQSWDLSSVSIGQGALALASSSIPMDHLTLLAGLTTPLQSVKERGIVAKTTRTPDPSCRRCSCSRHNEWMQ
jgi:hypothetical protein